MKLHKIVEVHFRLLDTNDFHLKAKNERFTAAGSWRYRQHLKYEKCASLFGRVRHKLRQKAYRTCSNIIFPHSTNEIIEVSFAYTRKRLETSKQLATISNIACEQALRGTDWGRRRASPSTPASVPRRACSQATYHSSS